MAKIRESLEINFSFSSVSLSSLEEEEKKRYHRRQRNLE